MKNYARYSGMAFELLALVLIMVFVGKRLDAYFHNKKSFITAILVVFSVIGYMIKLYYEIVKNSNNE